MPARHVAELSDSAGGTLTMDLGEPPEPEDEDAAILDSAISRLRLQKAAARRTFPSPSGRRVYKL